jgi:predicted permease
MLLFSTLATFLYFQQAQIIRLGFDDPAQRTALFAAMDFTVNALPLVLQVLLTGRIVKQFGLGWTLALIPLLLPLAADRGIATLINRPFQRGSVFSKVTGQPLPLWSGDIDCSSWCQFFLKYVISHPAVTCVIPATPKPHHMLDNMDAGFGRMPNARQRSRMEPFFNSL